MRWISSILFTNYKHLNGAIHASSVAGLGNFFTHVLLIIGIANETLRRGIKIRVALRWSCPMPGIPPILVATMLSALAEANSVVIQSEHEGLENTVPLRAASDAQSSPV